MVFTLFCACLTVLATDNSIAERAFFKGYSSSPKLDSLVLRLRNLELVHSFRLHLIHVSGKRMCGQGTDGLSRADKGTGLMIGHPLAGFLPLNLTAFHRAPRVKQWVREVFSGLGNLTFLDPSGWFRRAHSFGNFIWSPPPAAAEVVVEQLSLARHKRPSCGHVVLVPRLFTAHWRKHLTRATDMYFKVDTDNLWPMGEHYEPLLIFVCLPLSTHRPEFERKAKLLEELEWTLLGPPVQEMGTPEHGNRVRELLSQAREFCRLPRDMAR